MKEFFFAGGYGFYLWMSYAAVAFGILCEVLGVKSRFKHVVKQLLLRKQKQ